jgi:hypothetical protein
MTAPSMTPPTSQHNAAPASQAATHASRPKAANVACKMVPRR